MITTVLQECNMKIKTKVTVMNIRKTRTIQTAKIIKINIKMEI